MEIWEWIDTKPSEVVQAVLVEKRFVFWAVTDTQALNFKRQDNIIKDILLMARKVKEARNDAPTVSAAKAKSRNSDGKGSGQTRWASADIRTKEHKLAVRELSSNADFVLDTIVELVDDGYDLHIKRTDSASTIRAMLFCSVEGNANKGGGLSAEAPDAWLALSALVYKHVTVLDGNWFGDADVDNEDDGWR